MNITNVFVPETINVAGIEVIDVPGFLGFLLRFVLNLAVVMILVRWLYYSATRRKDYLFTYILIANIVFLLCFLLESVKLQIGFALGLFAIFGILRYRTNAIPIKEMTYLFLVIGISVINALTSSGTTLVDLLFSNIVIIIITFSLEKVWLLKHESSKLIIFEKIDLIKPERYNELLNDLRERTGIKNIKRVEVGRINFLRDTCELTIFFETVNPDTYTGTESLNIGNNDDD
ncbi:MAG: DUF4956 domain-containing protein [Bacteroidales bacterium]